MFSLIYRKFYFDTTEVLPACHNHTGGFAALQHIPCFCIYLNLVGCSTLCPYNGNNNYEVHHRSLH